MKTYYLFSGFDTQAGFPENIAQSLMLDISDRKSLVFIASCPDGHEKTDRYMGVNMEWFRKIGIEFEQCALVDDRISESESKWLISNASCIFLMDGTTLKQIEFIKKYSLLNELKQFDGIVIGVSAGAINMSSRSFYSKDKDGDKTIIYDGLGLTDISVEPHFLLENKVLLENELLPNSYKLDIYALCDNSAIIIKDGKAEYMGDIYLISSGQIKKINCDVN